jgi:O-antigen ligase
MAIAALDLRRPRVAETSPAVHRPVVPPLQVRIVDILRLAIALLAIGNLGRLQLFFVGVKDIPLLFNDLVVLSVVSLGCVGALRNRRLVVDGPALAALLFAAVGFTGSILAVQRFGLTLGEFSISTLFLLRWLTYFGIYLVVINFAQRTDLPSIWTTLEKTILVFAAFGIFQSFFLPGFAQMVFPDQGWDVQGRRLVSTFLDPNFAGGLIVILLLVLLAQLAFGERVAHWKLLLLFTALILTISRSAFLGFFAGAAVIGLVRGHSVRLIRFGSLLTLLVLPFVPLILEFANAFGRFSMSGSTMTRFLLWTRAITVFLDNPVLGIGFNTYTFVQEAYGWRANIAADSATDGGLLFIAVLTGVVGLSIYVAMLVLVVRRCVRIWRDGRRSATERGLALGICAGTVAIVVHSTFLNSLLFHFIVQVLWINWGLVFLLERVPPPRAASEMGRVG